MEITPIIKDDYIALNEDITVSEMVGKLKNFEKRTALFFRKDKYLGLIEKKKLLKSRIDPDKVKLTNCIQKTPVLNKHADIIETAYLMYKSNLSYVPVEDNKKIIGVVNGLDVISLALKLPEIKKLKVNDVKLLKPKKVDKNAPVAQAMKIMYKERIDQVPVFDNKEVSGIISFKDILRKYLNWSRKRDMSARFNETANIATTLNMFKEDHLPVSNFSTNDNLVTIGPREGLKKALTLMTEKNITDLLVLEGRELVGILTVKNLLRNIGSLKIPKNYNIKFVGLNDVKLVPHQKYNLKKICGNEAFKLQRKINNELNFIVHLKSYEKDGGQQKFSVNLRLESPGKIITSTQEDWNLETALRKTFNNAKNEVEKRFKENSRVIVE